MPITVMTLFVRRYLYLPSIDKLTDDKISVDQDEEQGLIRLSFEGNPSKEADILLQSYELGIDSISRQYGKKFLNIKFRRE